MGHIGSNSPDPWQDVAGIIHYHKSFRTTASAAVVIIIHAYAEAL